MVLSYDRDLAFDFSNIDAVPEKPFSTKVSHCLTTPWITCRFEPLARTRQTSSSSFETNSVNRIQYRYGVCAALRAFKISKQILAGCHNLRRDLFNENSTIAISLITRDIDQRIIYSANVKMIAFGVYGIQCIRCGIVKYVTIKLEQFLYHFSAAAILRFIFFTLVLINNLLPWLFNYLYISLLGVSHEGIVRCFI